MYLWLKALHISAVLAWIATMFAVPAVAARIARFDAPNPTAFVALRAVFSRVGTPAMIVSMALGLWMAQLAGHFHSYWLPTKLGIVLLLSALHGVVAGRLRRAVASPEPPDEVMFARLSVAIGAASALVVFIVVLRP